MLSGTLLLTAYCCLAGVAVGNLRCEYRENPLGIDERQPRLTWIIDSKCKRRLKSAAGSCV